MQRIRYLALVELQALARQVLTSPNLADKLMVPDRLTDRYPGDGTFRPLEPRSASRASPR